MSLNEAEDFIHSFGNCLAPTLFEFGTMLNNGHILVLMKKDKTSALLILESTSKY